MEEKVNAIYELVSAENIPAPVTTHRLSVVGDGCMQNGLRVIEDFFYELGYRDGEKIGIVKGTVGTAMVCGIVTKVCRSLTKKKCEAEAQQEKKKERVIVIIKKNAEAKVQDNQAVAAV